MNQFISLSTDEVLELVHHPEYVIVDIRPVDAYNGWKLQGEIRGGHIPGARSLPVKWANYIDWIEIVRNKGISPDQTIIVYGYNREEIQKIANRFLKSGYESVLVYNLFTEEWSANEELPMANLDRYHQLVYPEWVKSLINGNTPAEYNGGDFILCHAHYRNPADYKMGHIPGAIELDTNWLESSETWNRREPAELKESIEKLGITKDTTVILYGRFSYPNNDDPFPGSSAGHLGSIRCAFILLYAGVKDVRILNGGIQSWLDAGYQLSVEDSIPTPVTNCNLIIPEQAQLAVDIPEAKIMIESDAAELVCVRSWPEYIGEVSGYNYIKKTGRIPGAIFGNCGTDAYHMENYRNLDHTCREYQEIVKEWEAFGVVPEKHNAFYCGTGWRGSEAWLNAYLMGWPKVSVFDGGWFEWSNDPDNPTESGLPA